jgi:hypothetical protein
MLISHRVNSSQFIFANSLALSLSILVNHNRCKIPHFFSDNFFAISGFILVIHVNDKTHLYLDKISADALSIDVNQSKLKISQPKLINSSAAVLSKPCKSSRNKYFQLNLANSLELSLSILVNHKFK